MKFEVESEWILMGILIIMKNLNWRPFFYFGKETNIECTECGLIKRVNKNWEKRKKIVYNKPFGIIKDYEIVEPSCNNYGYKQVSVKIKNIGVKTISVHKIIASVYLSFDGTGRYNVIDHINSNKHDNRVCNLRIVSSRENRIKDCKKSSNLPTGVYYFKYKGLQKYISQITINGIRKHLGIFASIEDAKDAYNKALNQTIQHGTIHKK